LHIRQLFDTALTSNNVAYLDSEQNLNSVQHKESNVQGWHKYLLPMPIMLNQYFGLFYSKYLKYLRILDKLLKIMGRFQKILKILNILPFFSKCFCQTW